MPRLKDWNLITTTCPGNQAVSRTAPLLALGTLVLTGVVVPAWVVLNTNDDGYNSWVYALVSMAISSIRFSWVIGSSTRHLFEMTAWVFYYVFLGLAPLVQLRNKTDPSTTPHIFHEYDTQAFVIVLLSQLGVILGSTWAARRARQLKHGQPSPRRHPRKTKVAAFFLLVISVGFVGVVGISALFDSRANRSRALESLIPDFTLRGLTSGIVSIGLLVVVVALLQLVGEQRALGKKEPIAWVLILFAVPVLLMIVNPLGSPRYVLGTVALSLMAAFGIFQSIAVYRLVSLMTLTALIVVFPVADAFRHSTDTSIDAMDPLISLTGGDFDAFAQINNTAWWVAENGISWGNQLLGALLFWVPRSFWPGKPIDTGVLLAEARGYGFDNLSAPIPAELYVNGSWFFLIVGTIFIGYFMRKADWTSEQRLRVHKTPTVVGSILPFFMLIMLRGSLLQATSSFALILVISWYTSDRGPDRFSDREPPIPHDEPVRRLKSWRA